MPITHKSAFAPDNPPPHPTKPPPWKRPKKNPKPPTDRTQKRSGYTPQPWTPRDVNTAAQNQNKRHEILVFPQAGDEDAWKEILIGSALELEYGFEDDFEAEGEGNKSLKRGDRRLRSAELEDSDHGGSHESIGTKEESIDNEDTTKSTDDAITSLENQTYDVSTPPQPTQQTPTSHAARKSTAEPKSLRSRELTKPTTPSLRFSKPLLLRAIVHGDPESGERHNSRTRRSRKLVAKTKDSSQTSLAPGSSSMPLGKKDRNTYQNGKQKEEDEFDYAGLEAYLTAYNQLQKQRQEAEKVFSAKFGSNKCILTKRQERMAERCGNLRKPLKIAHDFGDIFKLVWKDTSTPPSTEESRNNISQKRPISFFNVNWNLPFGENRLSQLPSQPLNPLQRQIWCQISKTTKEDETERFISPLRALFSASKFQKPRGAKTPQHQKKDAIDGNSNQTDVLPPIIPTPINQQRKEHITKPVKPILQPRPLSAIEDLPPAKLSVPRLHLPVLKSTDGVKSSRKCKRVKDMQTVLEEISEMNPLFVARFMQDSNQTKRGQGCEESVMSTEKRKEESMGRHQVRFPRFELREGQKNLTRLDRVREDYNYYHLHKDDYFDLLVPHTITIVKPESKPGGMTVSNVSFSSSSSGWIALNKKPTQAKIGRTLTEEPSLETHSDSQQEAKESTSQPPANPFLEIHTLPLPNFPQRLTDSAKPHTPDHQKELLTAFEKTQRARELRENWERHHRQFEREAVDALRALQAQKEAERKAVEEVKKQRAESKRVRREARLEEEAKKVEVRKREVRERKEGGKAERGEEEEEEVRMAQESRRRGTMFEVVMEVQGGKEMEVVEEEDKKVEVPEVQSIKYL
ncbi:hypothetical protein HDV05_006686 [Chytridiales sp. JEL 0842]|nr:hypothetical protein HDV05_006686 [Chytridiales sp. JEL 0842]